MSERDLIGEGYRTFLDEVFKKDWPDDRALRMIVEIAFYGGVHWALAVLDEMPDATERMRDELARHDVDAVRRIREFER